MNALKSIIESSPKADYLARLVTGRLGQPFNGQRYRQALFEALLNICSFDAIIETGTNRGSTTLYMAQKFSEPIFSIEYMNSYAEFSRIRLKNHSHVDIRVNDSVAGLKALFEEQDFSGKTVFVYLDAHWYDYLPLQDELGLILKSHKEIASVIMIDDFAVPHDKAYGFDSYKGGTLNYPYIESSLTPQSNVFFPSTPAEQETGFRQGCAVVSSNRAITSKLAKISLLKLFETQLTH